MTKCCEKCIGVSPIRGVVCNNKLCPCHSPKDVEIFEEITQNVDWVKAIKHSPKDAELERVIERFRKCIIETDDLNIGKATDAPLKGTFYIDGFELESFITQVYKAGQEGAYLPLEQKLI